MMIKTISKIGNSQGIIFDSALLQLARLKVGDEVNVEVHRGGHDYDQSDESSANFRREGS